MRKSSIAKFYIMQFNKQGCNSCKQSTFHFRREQLIMWGTVALVILAISGVCCFFWKDTFCNRDDVPLSQKCCSCCRRKYVLILVIVFKYFQKQIRFSDIIDSLSIETFLYLFLNWLSLIAIVHLQCHLFKCRI